MKTLSFCALLLATTLPLLADDKSTPLPDKGKAPEVPAVDFDAELPIAPTRAEALVRAAKEKRLVMTIFASSACPHCKAFHESVLIAPEFRAFAKNKLLLVIFDVTNFDAMTEAERDNVMALIERYKITATPHMIVETPAEKRLIETEGYAGSPAKKVVGDLTALWSKEFGS